MKHQMKSVGLTLVSILLFLGLLIGAHFIYKTYYVADNFQEQLSKIDGVKNVQIRDEKITITFNYVDNFKKSYERIDKIVADKNYEIVIIDSPSRKLEKIALESEIAVQEGIFRGNFTEMEHYIKNMAHDQGVNAKMFIDNQRVYLQFTAGNKYIYRMIERPEQNLPTVST